MIHCIESVSFVLQCFRHLCTVGADHRTDRLETNNTHAVTDTVQPLEVDTPGELNRFDQPAHQVSIFPDEESWGSSTEDRPRSFHLFDAPTQEPPGASSYLFDHQLSPTITQSDSDTDTHISQYQFTEDLCLGQEHEMTHFDLYQASPTQYFSSDAEQFSDTTIEKYLPLTRNSEQAFLCPPEQKRLRGLEERRPLKSLDLGFEPIVHPSTPLLTDDRAIAMNYSHSNASSSSSFSASDRLHRFSRTPPPSNVQMMHETAANSSHYFRPTHYTTGYTAAHKQRHLHVSSSTIKPSSLFMK